MTDYEYIMAQCRKYHFTKWDENELRECQSILPNLTREQLVSVYRSRMLDERHPLKQTAFKVLFADKVGKREERIKNLETDALIEEFKDKKSGNVALIRKEMRERYKANKGFDRSKIAAAFNASTKGDQQWVKSQVRKEQYGDSINPTLTLWTFFKKVRLDFQLVSMRKSSKPLCRAQGFERDFVPLRP